MRTPSSPDQGHTVHRKTGLEAAWAAVHENTPDGRSQYPFDPSETPVVGKRSREWTAVAPTELMCGREMARCLGGAPGGRWPE